MYTAKEREKRGRERKRKINKKMYRLSNVNVLLVQLHWQFSKKVIYNERNLCNLLQLNNLVSY